jgi:hypothetical protein
MGRPISLTAALGTVALITVGAPAVADPVGSPRASVIELMCDGTTYHAAINGNGNWGSPAHDVDSTMVFVPVRFGEISGTITDPEGNTEPLFTDPPATKGAGKHADLDCTFTDTFSFTEPGVGEFTINVSGEVSGFIAHRH